MKWFHFQIRNSKDFELRLPISPLWSGRKTYSTVYDYTWDVKTGSPCAQFGPRIPSNSNSKYSFHFYFDGHCDAFSIPLRLWMKSRSSIPYINFTEIPVPLFYHTLAGSEYHTQRLEHKFHPSPNKSVTISHVESVNERKVFIKDKLYQPFDHHIHQTSFNVMLSGCPTHTIAFEFLYKELAYSKAEYLSLQFPLLANHNVTFYQDNMFESRTILIRSLERNDNCYIHLRINPIHRINHYSGIMKLKHAISHDSNTIIDGINEPFMFIFLAPYAINLTWADADSICRSAGGHLPTVTSEEEEHFLVHAIQARLTDATIKHTCKYYSLCYVFLGLYKKQVIYYLYIVHIDENQ